MKAIGSGGSKQQISGYERVFIDEQLDKLRKEAKVVLKGHAEQRETFRGYEEAWREEWMNTVKRKHPQWEDAFKACFKKDFNSESISPAHLAYTRLACEHSVEPGTIENLVKELRREKKRMLKGYI